METAALNDASASIQPATASQSENELDPSEKTDSSRVNSVIADARTNSSTNTQVVATVKKERRQTGPPRIPTPHELSDLFGMSIKDAAKQLNMGLTNLKQLCRKYGMFCKYCS